MKQTLHLQCYLGPELLCLLCKRPICMGRQAPTLLVTVTACAHDLPRKRLQQVCSKSCSYTCNSTCQKAIYMHSIFSFHGTCPYFHVYQHEQTAFKQTMPLWTCLGQPYTPGCWCFQQQGTDFLCCSQSLSCSSPVR